MACQRKKKKEWNLFIVPNNKCFLMTDNKTHQTFLPNDFGFHLFQRTLNKVFAHWESHREREKERGRESAKWEKHTRQSYWILVRVRFDWGYWVRIMMNLGYLYVRVSVVDLFELFKVCSNDQGFYVYMIKICNRITTV